MIVLACTLLSGAMFYLSQGLDEIWWLAWFASAPVLWLAYGRSPRWQVLLASLVSYAAGLIYIIQCYGGSALLSLPTVSLPLVIPVLPFAASVLFARLVYRSTTPFIALLAFPACWTAVEYLTSMVSAHGSFGSLAYSQMSAPVLIQGASLFGYTAVTFLLCLSANAVALLACQGTGSVLAGGIAISICALNIGFGAIRLHETQTTTLRAAALADDVSRERWATYRPNNPATPNRRETYYASYTEEIERTIRTLAAKGARLVVLPEGGLIGHPPWSSLFLDALARETGMQIVAGIYHPAPPEDLALSFSPDGTVQTYSKRHLIPTLEAEFTPGQLPGLLGNGVATTICKDMDFPQTIRSDARNGIQFMAVPAGDFRLDDWIHARVAIMRGVENGFSILRAAGSGLLTASDAYGRLISRETTARPTLVSIIADIPMGPGPTLYTRIGAAFDWLCLALTLTFGAIVAASRKRFGPPQT
jgi:apolipoprotein N-acyltransferase